MAKSDEIARRIYKYLISLHTDCSDIQGLVKESGNLSREIKDLEEQVRCAFSCKNMLTVQVPLQHLVMHPSFVIRRRPNYGRMSLRNSGDCKATSNKYVRKTELSKNEFTQIPIKQFQEKFRDSFNKSINPIFQV